jgi:D-alanyl-D-alanine carboxypeptidase (penicillin-binding protein 5/6)
MPYTLLQGGGRRRRRRAPRVLALLVLLAAAAGAVLVLVERRDDGGSGQRAQQDPPGAARAPATEDDLEPLAGGGTAPSPLAVRLEAGGDPVRTRFKHMPRSGLLFDVDTGRVLWRHQPTRVLPIASLTKMMTALIVADRLGPRTRVPITREALRYQGSGVGLLPRGKRIRTETMLYGLMLPSGNDAAIALAQRAAGSVAAFVAAMNARAQRMGLVCSRFSTPHGFRDRGNHSCAGDLAAIARALLRVPRLARIVRSREAVLPFPIKGGKLYLYNNNPLLRQGYPGITGMKTGYTDAAGRCLVATARRGSVKLGVVLLHSPDPARQAKRLLDRGFEGERP